MRLWAAPASRRRAPSLFASGQHARITPPGRSWRGPGRTAAARSVPMSGTTTRTSNHVPEAPASLPGALGDPRGGPRGVDESRDLLRRLQGVGPPRRTCDAPSLRTATLLRARSPTPPHKLRGPLGDVLESPAPPCEETSRQVRLPR